jgi:hypothetical protein
MVTVAEMMASLDCSSPNRGRQEPLPCAHRSMGVLSCRESAGAILLRPALGIDILTEVVFVASGIYFDIYSQIMLVRGTRGPKLGGVGGIKLALFL